jgi:hypothetical protein
MEAMLGISLYSYPYLKLAKILYLSYYCLYLLFNNWRRGQNRFSLEAKRVWGDREGMGAGGKMAQTICAHMNK